MTAATRPSTVFPPHLKVVLDLVTQTPDPLLVSDGTEVIDSLLNIQYIVVVQ